MSQGLCLVCGGGLAPDPIPGLVRCGSCGFLTANLVLSEEELRALYSENYFVGGEYRDYRAEGDVHQRHFRVRIGSLLEQIADPGSKFLFEIGAAYGFFLDVARDSFARVEGVDISETAARYATEKLGVRVSACDFMDYNPPAPPDVICLWDTIEHLVRPDLYIEKAAAILPRGGWLALTTGDAGSLMARLRGRKWRQIHPPTHLHYFSKATLRRLLENNGLRVRVCRYEGTYRSLDTAVYIILMIKHHYPSVYHALKRSGLLGLEFYLNLFDTLFMMAQKQE